jgi:lipopolysaccharide biosynthesis glycosyltransferase
MTFDCTRLQQALFDQGANVVDIELDPRLRSLPVPARKGLGTYVRLSAIDQLRGIYRKLIYLDCDVWIGSRSISRLFEVDLGDYEIGATRDAAEILRGHSAGWVEYRQKLHLRNDAGYFNAGMLLINIEKYCSAGIGPSAISYLTKEPDPYHDQGALNAILGGRWLEISPLWNWMFGTRVRLTEKYDPAIIHFIGSNKPWKDRKAKHHPKYRAEMQRYLAAFGEGDYVEAVPAQERWRRSAINCLKDAKSALLGDTRDNRIDRFIAATKFADVEAGIVARTW